MFPIRDHNPSGRTPFVTYMLMAANVGIFLSYVGIMQNGPLINQFWYDWALIPAQISEGDGYTGLVSSMFLHGGWMHLAGNMLFLYIFGDNVEEEMGHVPYLIFYIVAGVAAGYVQYLTAPLSSVPTVGASGAIAGVMGSYLLLFPRAKVDILIIFIVFFRIIPIPAWIMLAIWFGLQFLGGYGADPDVGGVAYWAHAGGFIAGFVLTVPLWVRRGAAVFWRRTEGHPPHPEAKYDWAESSVPKVRRK